MALSFQTVRVHNGVTYEHIDTVLVDRVGDRWIVDEHVLVDGVFRTVRVEIDWIPPE